MAAFPCSTDARFARNLVIKTGARSAFYTCQTKDAMDRAVQYKPRVQPENYEVGDLVYIYRELKQGKGKKSTAVWTGPAVIIGRENSNYWAARGG